MMSSLWETERAVLLARAEAVGFDRPGVFTGEAVELNVELFENRSAPEPTAGSGWSRKVAARTLLPEGWAAHGRSPR